MDGCGGVGVWGVVAKRGDEHRAELGKQGNFVVRECVRACVRACACMCVCIRVCVRACSTMLKSVCLLHAHDH